MEFITDLINFIKSRKKWWLIPLIFILILLGFLLILAESSVVAPFIYPMF